MKMAVCIFIRNPEGKILAVSRKDDPDAFGLPGGKVDEDDESLKDAAKRELKEETGIVVSVEDLVELLQRVCEGEDDYDAVTYEVEFKETMRECKKPSADEPGLVRWVSWEELFNGPFGIYNKNLKEVLDGRNSKADSAK